MSETLPPVASHVDLTSFDRRLLLKQLVEAPAAQLQQHLLASLSAAHSSADWQKVYEAHQRWGQAVQQSVAERYPEAPAPKPHQDGRALKVGFLSVGLNDHPIGRCCQSFFTHHDPSQVEVFALSLRAAGGGDPVQAAIQDALLPGHWLNLSGSSSRMQAEQIRALDLDILIDLDGHHSLESGVALLAIPGIAHQTATYLGYAATSGLPLDALLIDQTLLPDDNGQFFTERKLIGLDIGFCLGGERALNRVNAELPALRNGYLTFGTLNNPNKWCDKTIGSWVAALNAVPGSRFLFGRPECLDPVFTNHWLEVFEQQGISRERLIFSFNEPGQHLALYDQIDIALDTYHNKGGMTTCEALLCGVPVLSLAHPLGARQPVNKLSDRILSAAGLTEHWLVPNLTRWHEQLQAMAADLSQLSALRQDIPSQLRSSNLFDGGAFAAGLTQALQQLAGRAGLERALPSRQQHR
jgi:protein O-GlcNAc transferase